MNNIADHQRHDFNHGNLANPAATVNIGIDNGHHAAVFRVGCRFRNNRLGVAGMKAAFNLVIVDHPARHRRMVVVIFVRGQPEQGKIPLVKNLKPRCLTLTEQFFIGKKLVLDIQTGSFIQRPDQDPCIRWRNDSLRLLGHWPELPVTDFAFEHFSGGIEVAGRLQALTKIDSGFPQKLPVTENPGGKGQIIIEKPQRSGRPGTGQQMKQSGGVFPDRMVQPANDTIAEQRFVTDLSAVPVDILMNYCHKSPQSI